MKDELNLSYKSFKHEKVDVNSEYCKFHRHHFAKFLIEAMYAEKRLLNFDETDVSQCVHIQKGWSGRGKTQRICSK